MKKRVSIHRIWPFAISVACAIALLLIGLLCATTNLWEIHANIANLQSLNVILWPSASNHTAAAPMADMQCSGYVTEIGALYSDQYQSLTPQEKLRILSHIRECLPPERQPLLAYWASDAEWVLGRYDAVCDSLVTLMAVDKLLDLAAQAAQAGNWSAVEAGLTCIDRFPTDDLWISPYIVGPIYFRLGQNYEGSDSVEQAIAAYGEAARWYPVVWAEPYIAKANLLWQADAKQEAIRWLVDGVSKSTDVTATFNLWRELGHYWVQQGQLKDAACAFSSALQIIAEVPPQNLAVGTHEHIQQELDRIGALPSSRCFESYPQLRKASSSH